MFKFKTYTHFYTQFHEDFRRHSYKIVRELNLCLQSEFYCQLNAYRYLHFTSLILCYFCPIPLSSHPWNGQLIKPICHHHHHHHHSFSLIKVDRVLNFVYTVTRIKINMNYTSVVHQSHSNSFRGQRLTVCCNSATLIMRVKRRTTLRTEEH